MNNIETRLLEIFRDVLEDPGMEVSPHLTPDATEAWDSVAQVNIVLAAEAEFGVRFSTDEISELKSFSDFVDAISRQA